MRQWLKKTIIVIPPLFLIAVLILTVAVNREEYHATVPQKSSIGFYGNGTYESPFIISSYEDISLLRDLVNSGISFSCFYFRQDSDIDFIQGDNWVPIGRYGTGCFFAGYYDGGGHTISNLRIDTEDAYAGLFGDLRGEVRNLGIESGDISGKFVGGIAGYGRSGRIINCYNKAKIRGLRAGGIADTIVGGEIISCINIGDISSPNDELIGGIVSYSCKRCLNCYSLNNQPVNSDFKGEITIPDDVANEYSKDFFTGFNDALLDELVGKYSKNDVVRMTGPFNDVRFESASNVTEFLNSTAVLYSAMIIVAFLGFLMDFLLNVRRRGNIKHGL